MLRRPGDGGRKTFIATWLPLSCYTPSKNSILAPDFRVTIAFFHGKVWYVRRPMRRVLPRMVMTLTPVTFTLNAFSTACLIISLLGLSAISKAYLFHAWGAVLF